MQFRPLLLLLLLLFSLNLWSQSSPHPRNYFRNPLAIPMQLAANFGELRPDHWHMGLDIRTNQRENQPVYAAAGGYIAHIGVRPGSFGRFIIINHANGLSTLYGHLNDFSPELEKYVTDQQYKQEQWSIELDFKKENFPVAKGQQIAWSGNTGGSQGPHLHFEIFDTWSGERFNPLLFGLPIQDNVAPDIVKLAAYDRERSVYEQSPQLFWLKKTDAGYIIPKITVVKTALKKISFAIQAFDKMSGSTNPNGIYSATIFLDKSPLINFVLDSIDYNETAYVNAHIDYREKFNGGPYLQHLSQLPGERSKVYHPINGDGVISLTDTVAHEIRIEVRDTYNNLSSVNFLLQYDASAPKPAIQPITSREVFVPNRTNEIKKPDFEMSLPEACIYDTIRPFYFRNNITYPYSVSAMHQLSDASFPLHSTVTVRIKPTKDIANEWKDKLVMQRSYRGNNVRKAEWQGEWITARFGDFGNFQVFADVLPPQINELGKGDTVDMSPAKRIAITPTDNFGIKNFRAELDGQWIRFTNDKGRTWIYNFDERCPDGVHQLKITVEDLVGNTTIKTVWFKKYPYTPPKKKVVKKKGSVKKKKVIKKK